MTSLSGMVSRMLREFIVSRLLCGPVCRSCVLCVAVRVAAGPQLMVHGHGPQRTNHHASSCRVELVKGSTSPIASPFNSLIQ